MSFNKKLAAFAFTAVAAVSLSAGASSAAPLGFGGFLGKSTVDVDAPAVGTPPSDGSLRGNAGAFQMNDAGNQLGLGESFIAFCIDLFGTIGSSDYEITANPFSNKNVMSDFQTDNVAALFNANYGTLDVNDNVQAAAFQLAVWDAAYETEEAGIGVGVGLVQSMGTDAVDGPSVTALADSFLSAMLGYDGDNIYNVIYLEATRDANQDLVTVQLAPVPVPAGILLMGTALAGFGVMRRRKKTA
jgi:hypothetical protein